jgi:hypothetical protein
VNEISHRAQPNSAEGSARTPAWLLGVRYGIPAVMITAGIVVAFVASGEAKVEGFAGGVGAGLSVLLLNVLFRMGVQGEDERAQEEAAREYYAEHGVWERDESEGDEPDR